MKREGLDRKGPSTPRNGKLAELNGQHGHHSSQGAPSQPCNGSSLAPPGSTHTFIIQDGPGKPQDPALRRLIRSHVMQGRFVGQKKQRARKKKDVTHLQSEPKLPSPRPVSGYSLVPFAENLDPETTGLLRDREFQSLVVFSTLTRFSF